jgi:hypothetical protein
VMIGCAFRVGTDDGWRTSVIVDDVI